MKDHFSLSLCQPLDKGKGLCQQKCSICELDMVSCLFTVIQEPEQLAREVSIKFCLLHTPTTSSSLLHLLHRSRVLLGIPVDLFYMWLVVPSICSFIHSSSWHTSLYLLFHLNCVHLSLHRLSCSPPTPDPAWAPKGCGQVSTHLSYMLNRQRYLAGIELMH